MISLLLWLIPKLPDRLLGDDPPLGEWGMFGSKSGDATLGEPPGELLREDPGLVMFSHEFAMLVAPGLGRLEAEL